MPSCRPWAWSTITRQPASATRRFVRWPLLMSDRAFPTLALETLLAQSSGGLVCGVDEAGRGPWAGPVSAGAVILNPRKTPKGLNDSKKLSAKQREALEIEIKA